ncbi:hypothetical protein L1049_013098 [Liquidambar formosana]|uniref:PB1 domain-containing protein n=1 Tax=Liquidambar formosana TaxID=63359 RepID=A0AAP0RJX8_LIQFO
MEDLDALVSITSDEDLANLVEEYDRAASPPSSFKIRAFLSPPKSVKQISPPPSTASSTKSSSYASAGVSTYRFPVPCRRRLRWPPTGATVRSRRLYLSPLL